MVNQKPKVNPYIGIVALSLILAFSSCNSLKEESGQNYVKLVKTATVTEIPPIKQKHFPGIIEEAEEFNLAFRVAGPIHKIYSKEGQYVKKGQLIAELDTRDYQVQKKAIEAQVLQLQSEYKRVEELRNRKSVSENDYEKMKAGKEMAEAQLKNAIDQLSDTRLTAPFSGYITKVMFEDGELVNHGTPIAKMVDVSKYKVEIFVPATMYINRNSITGIVCTQENLPGQTFPLNLYANNIKANNNGLYKFYLYHQPEVNSKLAPGMNVSVKINFSDADSSLFSIPVNAIFEKDNQSHVWVVSDAVVTSRKVRTNNQINNGRIGIVEGLDKNEHVVTGGLNLLKENEMVKIIKPASKTNIGNLL